MKKFLLSDIEKSFPKSWDKKAKENAKTLFLKELSVALHSFYGGKIQMVPKAPLLEYDYLNLWYTPGVSGVSTAIRDNQNLSFELSQRGNSVAVVSDSTRVLGDGDCGVAGGLGVMEGKAYLMKYLGGIDAFPLCVDTRNRDKSPSINKLVDFVKMVSPSFGAINLEDISAPNCYQVLSRLQTECAIPVWHDDAQGTACVLLAGVINSLKLVGKRIETSKFVLLGAGASNTTVAEFLLALGALLQNIILFDSVGSLHIGRQDIKANSRLFKKWELCKKTNPQKVLKIEDAAKGADFIIALSKPDPTAIKPSWIKSMNCSPVVFACANPVPEIYPYLAKQAGARVVATGRGDYPNQLNNSLGFPGILKGVLLCRASKITDKMAITASYAIAEFSEKKGISEDKIITKMSDTNLFPFVASKVGLCAIEQGVAKKVLTENQIYKTAKEDIYLAQKTLKVLTKRVLLKKPPKKLFEGCLKKTISQINS